MKKPSSLVHTGLRRKLPLWIRFTVWMARAFVNAACNKNDQFIVVGTSDVFSVLSSHTATILMPFHLTEDKQCYRFS